MPKSDGKTFCAQPLDVALKAALSGELEDVVLGLLRTPAQYDAQQLKLAMKVTNTLILHLRVLFSHRLDLLANRADVCS